MIVVGYVWCPLNTPWNPPARGLEKCQVRALSIASALGTISSDYSSIRQKVHNDKEIRPSSCSWPNASVCSQQPRRPEHVLRESQNLGRAICSRQYLLDDLAADSGQAVIEALVEVGQSRVVQAHQVENRGVEVGDMATVVDGIETELVGRSNGLAALDPRTGQPHCETVGIVIAAGLVDSFAGRSPAELAAPDDQCLIPQSRSFQVGEQRGDRLIRLAGMGRVVLDAVGMAVPGVFQVTTP